MKVLKYVALISGILAGWIPNIDHDRLIPVILLFILAELFDIRERLGKNPE